MTQPAETDLLLPFDNTDCEVFKRRGQNQRVLHKNQHTQRKLFNLQFWINGELSKIGHHFSDEKIKNVNNKKCAPKLVFFNEKTLRMIPMIFDIEN